MKFSFAVVTAAMAFVPDIAAESTSSEPSHGPSFIRSEVSSVPTLAPSQEPSFVLSEVVPFERILSIEHTLIVVGVAFVFILYAFAVAFRSLPAIESFVFGVKDLASNSDIDEEAEKTEIENHRSLCCCRLGTQEVQPENDEDSDIELGVVQIVSSSSSAEENVGEDVEYTV
ncbi:expressed unknown protein [Seminavis robusta]|uniref:Transmembrane protein n=1 Tax=Seminavis robusta TaxID=568900 RepID=A0A9N8D955_9STRA|nr:expressed unknown protein [Seminavis robusta]|eukprot:Sro37_g023451.1  (172) ;mRNA; r:139234-139749